MHGRVGLFRQDETFSVISINGHLIFLCVDDIAVTFTVLVKHKAGEIFMQYASTCK